MKSINVVKGDITNIEVDIIVNAANRNLSGGGGVDGAIHKKVGIGLYIECEHLNGCNTGEAKMTDAYNLPAKKIIHTVGPTYMMDNREILLKNCYISTIKLAEEYRVNNNLDEITISFPCISTGLYKYPKDEASKIAVDIIKSINNDHINVLFVCYEDADYDLYKEYLKET